MFTIAISALALSQIVRDAELDLPPRHVLAERAIQGDTYRETSTPWNGMRYREVIGSTRHRVDGQSLLDGIYRSSDLPGLQLLPAVPVDGAHTVLAVDANQASVGRTFSSPEQTRPPRGTPNLTFRHPVRVVNVAITCFESAEEAVEYYEGRVREAAGARSVMKGGRLPSGSPILGDVHWMQQDTPLAFVTGRTLVRAPSVTDARPSMIEAMAWGLDFHVLTQPKLTPDPPLQKNAVMGAGTVGRATDFRGEWVVPMSVLAKAGVKVEDSVVGYERHFVLSRGARQVKLFLFDWEMSVSGTVHRLIRPVFPCRGEVYVPLEDVSKALDLKFTLR
jgi:hypothetical protein